jgi:hypothetical protein
LIEKGGKNPNKMYCPINEQKQALEIFHLKRSLYFKLVLHVGGIIQEESYPVKDETRLLAPMELLVPRVFSRWFPC